MTDIQDLIQGYQEFKRNFFTQEAYLFEELITKGQRPQTAIIACSDSRVDPAIITNAKPGDLFVIRNVANLVPPYEDEKLGYHGTSAALEFAVCGLGVKNIIVFGHSLCGGMSSLFDGGGTTKGFVGKWMDLAEPAFQAVNLKHNDCDIAQKVNLCSKYSLINSLNNLKTFPWIYSRLQQNELRLHAWYFDISTGSISFLNQENQFQDL
jgi:carbonic anhydrase